MNAHNVFAKVKEAISEREWTAQVRELAMLTGHLFYHTHDSRHSAAGFPDCVIAGALYPRLIFAELKRESGKVTADQQMWIDVLRLAGQEVYVWKPSNFQEVVGILKRR